MSAHRLVDGPAIASALKVEPARIRQWAARGKLQRRGRDERGRALYDLDEVRALADAPRRSASI